ncbi:S8 family serine peptidase [Actinoplanes sp. NEAU-A12]|uniref:S8 family serine peptidase n=1 Tax=Actinoplanes sandaracinus TaxID=3045177 RepID=A0ABT6WPN5_9ACTN|nr:S8 family serine peptidase [Actinoplanes sandaracinus]MDI6101697.1 S8 family serine peptidase [Actinoplanes sandaracinus]
MPAPAAEPGDAPKAGASDELGAHDAGLLSEARSGGKRDVTVIIATESGEAADVAGEVERLGGTVAQRFDRVGYVLAQMPTGSVVKASKLPGVAAIDLDETIKLPDPVADRGTRAGAAQAAAVPGPGPGTPAVNGYMPTADIGSVAFKRKHPTWDGRGVTIGIMDSGVDLENPALKTTSTGERKIVDWVTATDPLLENDRTWRPMLSAPPSTYTVPAGSYLFNTFAESITGGSDPAGDVNRDGDTTDVFGILYDPASHDIRVDTNQNQNFTDDAVMRPYKEKFDVGHFGTDNPATPIAERIPFVVEFREDVDMTPAGVDRTADFVNIGISESTHGTHVAGIAAANDMLGNAALDGQAPGAKLVSSRACSWGGGCTAAALTTGMVDLVVNRGVDVINMSIGGLPALNDGSNARAQLYNRLINDYGVQMFISAGNSGPGLNTIGDPSVASDVVSVAASVSKETWLTNYGSVVREKMSLFPFSSRGPREDGGFKPNISAPGSAVSTVNTWIKEPDLAEAGYTLPIGLAMFNGTSMASPQAAGAAALLLSAGFATDKGITPAQLRRALYTSADQIPNVPVTGQGNGLMDVNGAWALLSKKVETRNHTASAPVCTPFSDLLTTPGRGSGIYNRCPAAEGGQRAGTSRVYNVEVTRTSGPDRNIRHDLKWLGDKSFTAARNVSLPLNRAVTIPVKVTARDGLNSAVLRIDDPATSTVDFEVMNTVIASSELRKPSYASTFEGAVDRNSTTSFFVTVPAGADALQVNLSGIATASQTRWVAINPWGVPVDPTSTPQCYTNFSDPSDTSPCKPAERSYENPMPGVWEFEVEARRTSPVLSNPFELTARIQGVAVEPATVELPAVTAGKAAPVSWNVTNRFGPVSVVPRGGPLGSAATARPTIANGAVQQYEVTVPAGADRLDVSIGNVSDPAADLDLTVRLNGAVVGQSADGDSEESVSIAKPAAGVYTVVVDGYAVPSGSTAYDYRDVYFSGSLGSLTVPATPVALAAGQTLPVTGSVTAKAAPQAGRNLFGQVSIVTDMGAVVGRGSVLIGAVN